MNEQNKDIFYQKDLKLEAENQRYSSALLRRGIYLIIGGFLGAFLFNLVDNWVNLAQLGNGVFLFCKISFIFLTALTCSIFSWLLQRILYVLIILGLTGLTILFILDAYSRTHP